MLFGDFQAAIVRARAGPAADGKNPLQTGFTSARQHVSAISRELFTFNVGVRINVQADNP
jgi:hypothetical protein